MGGERCSLSSQSIEFLNRPSKWAKEQIFLICLLCFLTKPKEDSPAPVLE